MQQACRLISVTECEKVNSEIISRFGSRNQVVGGSCEEHETGKLYNIVLEDTNAQKSSEILKEIGEIIKNLLGASEVYYFGTKIT